MRRCECTQEKVDAGWEYVNGGYAEKGEFIPTTQGLAIHLGTCRMTPYNWAHQENNTFREEFEAINDRLMAVQAVTALNGGLGGTLNASIVRTVVGHHGYSEKQAVEHTGTGGGPIQWTVLPVRARDADSSDS